MNLLHYFRIHHELAVISLLKYCTFHAPYTLRSLYLWFDPA